MDALTPQIPDPTPTAAVSVTPTGISKAPAKRPFPPSNSNNKGNTRFNKRFKPARHGGAAYEKKDPGSSLQTYPIRPYWPAFTSTLGCISFVNRIYQCCVGKDYRYGNNVTLPAMQYATLIAMIARLAMVAEKFGTRIDDSVSRLRSVSKSIILPTPICKMIECLGVVNRPGFPSILPLFPPWEEYRSEHNMPFYAQPAELLEEMGREVPTTPWCIDTEALADYINHSARGESRNLGFRPVNNESFEGRLEMLYGYYVPIQAQPGELQPQGPSQATEAEAQLGAAYCWRRHHSEPWPSAVGNHLVQGDYQGSRFDVPTLVARLASEHTKLDN